MGFWVALLVLLVVLYLVVLVRGFIQIGSWFVEEFRTEPKEPEVGKRQAPAAVSRFGDGNLVGLGPSPKEEWRACGSQPGPPSQPLALAVGSPLWHDWPEGLLRARDTTTGSAPRWERAIPPRNRSVVEALDLDPGYEPGWGLKAAALLELERYEEAIGCFDKVLSMRPSAMAWHRKGLCCYHLKRYADAVACFDRLGPHVPTKIVTCSTKRRVTEARRRSLGVLRNSIRQPEAVKEKVLRGPYQGESPPPFER